MAMNMAKIPHDDRNGPILHKIHVPKFSILLLFARKYCPKINCLLKTRGLHGRLDERPDDL